MAVSRTVMRDSSLAVYGEVWCEGERTPWRRWGWHHHVLLENALARNVLLQRETKWEEEGLAWKGNIALWGGIFVLSPGVGDNMADSLSSHISVPHIVWIWGILDCTDGWILRSGCLMSKHAWMYKEGMSFHLGDNLNNFFDSFVYTVARGSARAFY